VTYAFIFDYQKKQNKTKKNTSFFIFFLYSIRCHVKLVSCRSHVGVESVSSRCRVCVESVARCMSRQLLWFASRRVLPGRDLGEVHGI
jgi:hypothetical protein